MPIIEMRPSLVTRTYLLLRFIASCYIMRGGSMVFSPGALIISHKFCGVALLYFLMGVFSACYVWVVLVLACDPRSMSEGRSSSKSSFSKLSWRSGIIMIPIFNSFSIEKSLGRS